jgi:hypothetical protein
MSRKLQPDHYPSLKTKINSEKGELTLQSFEPYSKSRPHLVEISVNGETELFTLSNIQECLSPCKVIEVGDKTISEVSIGGKQLHIENIVFQSRTDKKFVKIELCQESIIVLISDFQKALTELKQYRYEKLKLI